jgi:hypothetical protein
MLCQNLASRQTNKQLQPLFKAAEVSAATQTLRVPINYGNRAQSELRLMEVDHEA